MVVRASLFWKPLSLALLAPLCLAPAVHAVTRQSPDDVLPDGSAFLWVEGETFLEAAADPEVGFIRVDKQNPIRTIDTDTNGNAVVNGGLDVLPADTNASGGAALFAQLGGGGTATWEVEFAIPATYYMYVHWSMFNRDNNTNYGNEDSFYIPPSFNANSRDDWIGFEGVDINGDPKTGDSNRDGYVDGFPTFAQNWVSGGGVEVHNDTGEEFYEGQYHWYWIEKTNDMDADGMWQGFDGQAIQYEVTDDDVGTVLDYQISLREPYGSIDGILFSTSNELLQIYDQEQLDGFILNPEPPPTEVGDFDESGVLDLPDVNMLSADIGMGGGDPKFDITGDGAVDAADLDMWVKDLRKTWFGDANLDGEFSTNDLITALQAGTYEVDEVATWDQGDWNADLRFDTNDLIKALQDGGFEQGPVQAVSAVPEPSSLILLLSAITFAVVRRRPQ